VDSGWREMCNHSSSSLGVDDFDFAFAFAFAYLLIDSMKSATFVKLSDDRKIKLQKIVLKVKKVC
jgi:hypothetical protein